MKTTWKDSQGRTWKTKITIETAGILKDQGIDLFDNEQLSACFMDPLKVVDLICKVHRSQSQALDFTDGDLAEICTETVEVAKASTDALIEAIADFFVRLGRPALADVIRKQKEATDAAEAEALQTLKEIQPETLSNIRGNVKKLIRETISDGLKSGSTRAASA